jgi:hypothetical protein
LQSLIYAVKIAQDVRLGIVSADPMPVKNGRAFAFAPRRARGGVELELFSRVVVPEGLGKAGRNFFQVNLADAVARALEQPEPSVTT